MEYFNSRKIIEAKKLLRNGNSSISDIGDKLSFFDNLMSLPMRQPGEVPKADEFKLGIVSHQHPDHDTEHWPPPEGYAA